MKIKFMSKIYVQKLPPSLNLISSFTSMITKRGYQSSLFKKLGANKVNVLLESFQAQEYNKLHTF